MQQRPVKKKFHYLINLAYWGTHFKGLQKQKGTPHLTIQDAVEKSLVRMLGADNFTCRFCSRTDSGVHALSQKMLLKSNMELGSFVLQEINQNIHSQLRVTSFRDITGMKFPLMDGVESKTYDYFFSLQSEESRNIGPFFQEKLKTTAIKEALGLFVGEYNFRNFQLRFQDKENAYRKLTSLSYQEVPESHPFYTPGAHVITVKGKGFLRHMVRILVGTLWNIGQERVSVDDVKKSLEGSFHKRVGFVAPSSGLVLREVHYPQGLLSSSDNFDERRMYSLLLELSKARETLSP